MVMNFTPPGNASGLCTGLEQRRLDRPDMIHSYFTGNLVAFILYAIWLAGMLLGVVMFQNHPRFSKIRPLGLSLSAMLAALLYVSSVTIALALEWPCIYFIIVFTFGVSLAAITITMRALVICLEAQYAKLATVNTNRVQLADAESDIDSHGKQSGGGAIKSLTSSFGLHSTLGQLANQIVALKLLMGLVFNVKQLRDLSLQEVSIAKSHYALFQVAFMFPGLIVILCLVFAVPQTYLCLHECREIFLEVEIGYVIVLVYLAVFCLRVLTVMYRMVGWDDQGLLMEMVVTVPVVGLFILLAAVLSMVDPGDLLYSREFNWQALGLVAGMTYSWTTFGYQILIAIREDRSIRLDDLKQQHVAVIKFMVPILEQHPDVRNEFEKFAVKNFVVESVQFLEDVAQFKRLFYEKPDNWRSNKVHLLVRNYIVVGTALEINISALARDEIIRRAQGKISTESFNIFDQAYEQVKDMLQNGAWRQFVKKHKVTTNGFEAASTMMRIGSPLINNAAGGRLG
ncbi:hypothetical protein BASA81_012376 [Batrachochytrium salamandrivorans]|nr:hypothetical protein BASA81_012376 [Batrachochytrium salamandrivorans]